MSRLSSFFACLALILACIGLYGLLSYEVARRTRELGIRMALGAQRRELMRLVVRRGFLLALAGTVIGTGTAIAVTRLISAMLYNVRPYDPATFAGVASCLCWWRWSRVQSPRGGPCASTRWSRCATSDSHSQNECS
jgi:ABC-type antimicrobial peptide transport system permease subunit